MNRHGPPPDVVHTRTGRLPALQQKIPANTKRWSSAQRQYGSKAITTVPFLFTFIPNGPG